ncbi:hypothetical protein [Methanosarcina mazei]|uniref:Uncharacterized protein n=1 Tax=Methanosarcina mazei TaxID=2209 RepID=A0A0F8HD61_METMZ|nr:hypothetical protein [Methanosarcina mazei]KKG75617.1 hypothetical protein DU46_17700 [Methanosarcina mazei]KKG84516.1 hypothetical protein DU61_18300 [Methanosarcina mazei]KKH07217.1 hypothetical protein DU62_15985 [Methanosarcina mazei]KKH09964.1 hypothetical protein DU51_00585 [Methanosarcina mazei]
MTEDYEPEIFGIPMIPFGGIVGFLFLLLVVVAQHGGISLDIPDIPQVASAGSSQSHDYRSFQGSDGIWYQYSRDCKITYYDGVAIAASQPGYPQVLFVPIGSTAEETQMSLTKTQEMHKAGSLPV